MGIAVTMSLVALFQLSATAFESRAWGAQKLCRNVEIPGSLHVIIVKPW
ncbi:MAG: hypothetical protein ABWY82_11285 [Tardiphaga sp.]|jgi:hypothetical protein